MRKRTLHYRHTLLSLALSHTLHPFDSRAQPRNLILGGEETQPNKYPYYTEVKPDRENVCGGTLVAPDMVLSHPQCE